MSNMFKENGFLTEEGQKVLQPVYDGFLQMMLSQEVQSLSVQELHVLQANLAKLVGDTISEAIYLKMHEDK